MRSLAPLALAVLAMAVAHPAAAQFGAPADPCPPGTAEAWLRGAQVEAALYTNSNLFYNPYPPTPPTAPPYTGIGYFVPRTETAPDGLPPSPLDVSSVWVGGRVGGEVRTSFSGYSLHVFRPGRTGPDGTPPSPAECAEADRIWVVSRDDVEAYLDGTPPSADLAEWPVHLGAPVLDGDGLAGNYDLAGGDQPALRGDVTAFWVMTDTAAERDTSGASYRVPDALPVGVDVTVEAFALRQALVGTETFYRYTLTNRNAVAIDSAYVSLFTTWDKRQGEGYFLGTDVEGQMVYVYSPPDERITEASIYPVPPAVGVVLLEGVPGLPNGQDDDGDGETDERGEPLGLTSSRYLHKSPGLDAFPGTVEQAYVAQRGLMNDGSPVRARGRGFDSRGSSPTTVYFSPGDPTTLEGWSEMTPDESDFVRTCCGSFRQSIASTGPFRLGPGESATVTAAYAFAQGEGPLSSVRQLRAKARGLLNAYRSGTFDPVRVGGAPPPVPLTVRRPSPNPFRGATTLAVEERGAGTPVAVRVSVVDALGRRVAGPEAVVARPGATVEVGRGLAPGVYLVRVEGAGFAETFPITKLR